MKISKEVKGELFILGDIFTWAIFPLLVNISAGLLPVFFFAGMSMIIAGITTFIVLFFKKNSFNFKNLPWVNILISVFFFGIVFFPIFILAGQHTTAGNMAILGKSEVLFSFLFFGFLGIDKVNKERIFGVGLILLGVISVIIKDFSGELNLYDFLLVGICAFAPFLNYFQQKVVKKMPPITYLSLRNFIAGFFLLGISFFFENIPTLEFSHWKILILSGVVAFGISKIFWLEAIKRIDVSKALSLAASDAVITLILAFFFLNEIPKTSQAIGLFAILLGVYLITHHERNLISK